MSKFLDEIKEEVESSNIRLSSNDDAEYAVGIIDRLIDHLCSKVKDIEKNKCDRCKYEGDCPLDYQREGCFTELTAQKEPSCNEGVEAAIVWLEEAAEDIASWGAYASEYFQQKHDLQFDIAKYESRVEILKQKLGKKPKQ